MSYKVEIPDARKMMALSDRDFAIVAAEELAKYDMRRGAFNLAANSDRPVLTPVKDKMYFYPEEAQSFISTGLKVLEEFDAIGKVTPDLREKFIIEQTKDALNTMPAVQSMPHIRQTDEYKTFYDATLEHVTSRMKGLGSVTHQYSVKYDLKPPKP